MCNYVSKSFINFDCKVDETVRYQCRNVDLTKVSDKEIFKIGQNYYYYLFNRNDKVSTFSLREITKEEYLLRKEEFFLCRPNGKFGKFSRDENEYFIGCYRNSLWKKTMPINDCLLFSPSPLKEIWDAVKAELEVRERISRENEANSRKEYAKLCGALGHRLNISYVNVLRIGTKEEELRAFRASYNAAIEKIRVLPLTELRRLQVSLFRHNSRARRMRAMTDLGIEFFNADVMLMDLSELENVVEKPLREYSEDSVKLAIENALDLSYDERLEIANEIMVANRTGKREILRKLGIEADAIDLNTYPLAKIKYRIQSSVAMEPH